MAAAVVRQAAVEVAAVEAVGKITPIDWLKMFKAFLRPWHSLAGVGEFDVSPIILAWQYIGLCP